jgi:SPP1 family predicted phage head-tail adaptor
MLGLLKHRVTLKKETKQPNGRGGMIVNELDLGVRWAAFTPPLQRQITEFMKLGKEIDSRIIMRADPEMDSSCVIYYKDKKYRAYQIIDRLDHMGFVDIFAKGEKI